MDFRFVYSFVWFLNNSSIALLRLVIFFQVQIWYLKFWQLCDIRLNFCFIASLFLLQINDLLDLLVVLFDLVENVNDVEDFF